MLDALATPPLAPFALAAAILALLLALEIVMLLLGGSLLADMDAPDAAPEVPELQVAEIEALEAGAAAPSAFALPDAPPASPPPLGLTGFGRVPFLIWLGALLAGFSATGLAIQATGPWPLWLALPPAALAAVLFARAASGAIARAVPQVTTAAVSPRHLARRRGRVTQGTMRRDRPAEVRVTDRHGNSHYVRAEPLRDGDVIARGAEVLTVWDRRASALRVVSLD